MRAVLAGIAHEPPLVLKGGTALRVAYGLDRPSEDLDFDSARKPGMLLGRIHAAAPPELPIERITVAKDTETVTRLRVLYTPDASLTRSLRIEISYRTPAPDSEVVVVDGIRVATLPRILDQKLAAAHDGDRPRTKARDLYDLDFIARVHPSAISPPLLKRLRAFTSDLASLAERYRPAFSDDVLEADVDDIVLSLSENVQRLNERQLASRQDSGIENVSDDTKRHHHRRR